jgi:hypothetical protein
LAELKCDRREMHIKFESEYQYGLRLRILVNKALQKKKNFVAILWR